MNSAEDQVISEQGTTFFTVHAEFPELIDGKIETYKFLEASRGVVELIERMGKGFGLVKHDVLGNVEKLNKKYLTDPIKFNSLTDMILDEHSEGGYVAQDALLWLKRALNFVETFLGYLIEDFHSNNNEEISVLVKKAYEATLSRYHNWLTRKLFRVVVRICPSKVQMFLLLALGKDDMDPKIIIEGMEAFVASLRINLQEINKFYLDNHFEESNCV